MEKRKTARQRQDKASTEEGMWKMKKTMKIKERYY